MSTTRKIAWAVMENHGYSEVKDLESHKYLQDHPNCIWYSNYFATNHPSGPNYRVMAAGNHITDSEEYGKEFPCIASLLYQQSKASIVINLKGVVADRHNPFKDMRAPHVNTNKFSATADILNGDPDRFAHIYFGWDDLNNAHSGSLQKADRNLLELIHDIEHSVWFQQGNVFLFTWDESFTKVDAQHVACAALCKDFQNKVDNKLLSHYNLCKTLYNNYGLFNSYLKDIDQVLF